MKVLIASLALLGLAACATSDPQSGWSGQNAMPFDAAFRECEAQTLTNRGPIFNACMADKGWTRTAR